MTDKWKNDDKRITFVDEIGGWGNAIWIAAIATVVLMVIPAIIIVFIQAIGEMIRTDPTATRIVIIACSIFIGLLAIFRLSSGTKDNDK